MCYAQNKRKEIITRAKQPILTKINCMILGRGHLAEVQTGLLGLKTLTILDG